MGLWSGQAAKLCLFLLIAVPLACAPALSGSWVYDDWATAQHPAQDGLDDLAQVFARDSSAYMVNQRQPSPIGVTYRPLSMASLIVVQALHPDAPWLHHLVSLGLHLAAALALYAACVRLRGVQDTGAALLCAAFALHPVTVEAYGWINGRSDVLAGAFVATLAWSLPFSQQPPRRAHGWIAALCALGAALAKEPAFIAIAVLLGAALLPSRGLPTRAALRQAFPAAGAVVLGVAVALWARQVVTRGQVSGAATLLANPELAATYAQTLTLAAEHLVVPLPRTMLCLNFASLAGIRGLDIAVLVALCGALCGLCFARRFRAAMLLSGAMFCLLPVLPVSQLLWLGFDRYLYLPSMLLVVLSADLLPSAVALRAHVRPALRTFGKYGAWCVMGCFGVSSFVAAEAYANQSAWLASLVRERPDDPSGYIMATAWFLRNKDYPRARAALDRTPRSPLSPALAHDLNEQLVRLGDLPEAISIAERTFQAFPNSVIARFDAVQALGAQGRFREAYALASALEDKPAFCQPLRKWLSGWLSQPQLAEHDRATIKNALARLPCPSED